MAKQTNLRNVHRSVHALEEFLGSNLKGMKYDTGVGRLAPKHWDNFHDAQRADDFFVVYSYATPIAWHANNVWYVPTEGYSQSTKRQKSALELWKQDKPVVALD